MDFKSETCETIAELLILTGFLITMCYTLDDDEPIKHVFTHGLAHIVYYCSAVMLLLKIIGSNSTDSDIKENKNATASSEEEELWDSIEDVRYFDAAEHPEENISTYNDESYFEQNPEACLNHVSKEDLIIKIFEHREIVQNLRNKLYALYEEGDGKLGSENIAVKTKYKANLELLDLKTNRALDSKYFNQFIEKKYMTEDEDEDPDDDISVISLCDSLDLYRNLQSERLKNEEGRPAATDRIFKIEPDSELTDEEDLIV